MVLEYLQDDEMMENIPNIVWPKIEKFQEYSAQTVFSHLISVIWIEFFVELKEKYQGEPER